MYPPRKQRIRLTCCIQVLFITMFLAHIIMQASYFSKSAESLGWRKKFRNATMYIMDPLASSPVGVEESGSLFDIVPQEPTTKRLDNTEAILQAAELSRLEQARLLREKEDNLQKKWMEIANMTERMESEQCDDDFGFGLVRRWISAQSIWCSPTVTCYPLMQTNHGGNGDNLCVIHNASFNPAPYNDGQLTRKVVIDYRDTKHEDSAYLHHTIPIVGTLCSKDSSKWRNDQLPGWNEDWMVGGFAADRQPACDVMEEKALLIIERDGFANFYHDSEDFFNAFLALLITGLRPDQVRLLITDLYPWGPFESLWKHFFPDARTIWEMRQENTTCYHKIIIGIYGPASPLTLIRERSSCFRSPLVRAYGRWAWQSFGLAPQRSHNGSRLLWMSRQSSVLWPERAFCDDRYFVCADWTHLDIRSIGRVLANDADVVAALAARSELRVSKADFNKLPFQEQVATVASSDVLAGPHGAGMTHLLFLPDWACVFEIFIDGSENNIHFTNLATWRGLRYTSVIMENPAPTDQVVQQLLASCGLA